MLIRIDNDSSQSIYEQILTSIRADIANGRIVPGEKLPAAKELSLALGIHQHTVLHAYKVLQAEKLIELRRGRGAVVIGTGQASTELKKQLKQVAALAKEQGISSQTLVALLQETMAAESLGTN